MRKYLKNYIEGLILEPIQERVFLFFKRYRSIKVNKGFFMDLFYRGIKVQNPIIKNIFKNKSIKNNTWYHVFIFYSVVDNKVNIILSEYSNCLDVYYDARFFRYKRIGSILIHRKGVIKEIVPFRQHNDTFVWSISNKGEFTFPSKVNIKTKEE